MKLIGRLLFRVLSKEEVKKTILLKTWFLQGEFSRFG
jgi:hypothetical protein